MKAESAPICYALCILLPNPQIYVNNIYIYITTKPTSNKRQTIINSI